MEFLISVVNELNIFSNRLMKYNWQQADGPNFCYSTEEVEEMLYEFSESLLLINYPGEIPFFFGSLKNNHFSKYYP